MTQRGRIGRGRVGVKSEMLGGNYYIKVGEEEGQREKRRNQKENGKGRWGF